MLKENLPKYIQVIYENTEYEVGGFERVSDLRLITPGRMVLSNMTPYVSSLLLTGPLLGTLLARDAPEFRRPMIYIPSSEYMDSYFGDYRWRMLPLTLRVYTFGIRRSRTMVSGTFLTSFLFMARNPFQDDSQSRILCSLVVRKEHASQFMYDFAHQRTRLGAQRTKVDWSKAEFWYDKDMFRMNKYTKEYIEEKVPPLLAEIGVLARRKTREEMNQLMETEVFRPPNLRTPLQMANYKKSQLAAAISAIKIGL